MRIRAERERGVFVCNGNGEELEKRSKSKRVKVHRTVQSRYIILIPKPIVVI